MKAVPKVNTNGLFIEDVIMDDSFTRVVPFYADPADLPAETDSEEEQPEKGPAGYIVGVPVPAGLYKPRFDMAAWKAYQEAISGVLGEYQSAYEEWAVLPEEERGDAPVYVPPEQPVLWIEGLTQEEIDELTASSQHELNETEQLKQRIADLEVALAQLLAGK
ncbi:hypothetical protein [Paenibacillus jiagnxiensis]|uniref:hypothetical protein n=1 Tax=Paenibacillus jiagnxiensis TaxID=3228926 RepID=UPI0033A0F729